MGLDRTEDKASRKLDGVISAKRVTVDHLQSDINQRVIDRLPKEVAFRVFLQIIKNEVCSVGVDVSSPLSAPDRGSGLDYG